MSEERDIRLGFVLTVCGFVSIPLFLALGTPKSHPIVLIVLLSVCVICVALAERKVVIVLGLFAFVLLRLVIASVFSFGR